MKLQRGEKLERLLDIVLLIITILMVVFSLILEDGGWVVTSSLLLFILLFVLRWFFAQDRKQYLKANWFDLALIVLLTSPLLRLLVVLKIVGLLPMKHIHRMLHMGRRHLLSLLVLSKDSLPAAMAMVFGVVIIFGSLAYLLEHGQNPAFAAIDDGLWWAFATITTVGYGDITPVTGPGRLIGVFAMVFGVLIYSLVIANVTRLVETLDVPKVMGEKEQSKQNATEQDKTPPTEK